MGGTAAGWSLYLDARGVPVFEYRIYELGRIRIAGDKPVQGTETLHVDFDYDGGGYSKGGRFTLRQGERVVGSDTVVATPLAYYSIDETFDVGIDTGSPAGAYPRDAEPGYALSGASINVLTVTVD